MPDFVEMWITELFRFAWYIGPPGERPPTASLKTDRQGRGARFEALFLALLTKNINLPVTLRLAFKLVDSSRVDTQNKAPPLVQSMEGLRLNWCKTVKRNGGKLQGLFHAVWAPWKDSLKIVELVRRILFTASGSK